MTLLILAAALLMGVLAGARLDMPAPALGLFAAASALLAVLLATLRRTPLPAVLIVLVLLGMIRGGDVDSGPGPPLAEYHRAGLVQVEGVVTSDPEAAGTATRFRLAVERTRRGESWVEASGDVLVTLYASAEPAREREEPYFRYGDRLLLEGAIESPPVLEEFDYPAFLARQGIGSVMSFPAVVLLDEGGGSLVQRWLSGVRRRIARSVAVAVPEPQASIGQALLLGLRDNIPEELTESFRVTGTSHLLAISGLHIGILLGISLSISARAVGRRRQRYLLAPLVLIWLYALVAGMSPSVARAAIMGSVYLAALALGRHRNVLPALGLAAAVMVALDPRVLWSVSFQLSFAAMGGIAALAEPIGSWLKSRLGLEPAPGTSATSPRCLWWPSTSSGSR